ncbi:TauD/TfdA dioxygenase family protein [Noviherbaspirillum pedocola]|uniref:TauD/TfdA family dioxygenase n=1 Tax=Noviherbaspirillum pedocola TaxID=2801341 RepID=A0A934W9R1_9BURK|nr:TauD/TfdA family dioxygenase [Noviherbaspirillum pedocola]MBK4739315.1 TauD/TfdA family dioxygenase [Noviherbaspirillum pedocola]
MNFQHIDVRKLTPVIGAEIRGVDLSRPMPQDQFDEVRRALLENLVIFFRDQEMTIEQHKDFGRCFGELHIHPGAPARIPEHPEILVIHADENSKHVAGEAWHSDVSCDAEPPMGSILHLSEIPPSGGDTMFSNMYAAYDALSGPLKRLLEGLTAIHDGDHVYRGRYKYESVSAADPNRKFPTSEHPVVRTHPETGRRALYVNSGFTTRIVQLERAESDAILQMLYRHVERPEFQCRFKWDVNSVAFWDNRCAQHLAIWDYFPHRRHGNRVTIKGTRPFLAA